MFACKLWNPECWALESSIQLKEFLLAIGIQNPESTFHWQGIQNPVPGVRNPQHGIQNPILPWITLRGAMVPLPSWGGGGFVLPYIQGLYPFLNNKFKDYSRTLKDRLRVVLHFPLGIVERAKRERA